MTEVIWVSEVMEVTGSPSHLITPFTRITQASPLVPHPARPDPQENPQRHRVLPVVRLERRREAVQTRIRPEADVEPTSVSHVPCRPEGQLVDPIDLLPADWPYWSIAFPQDLTDGAPGSTRRLVCGEYELLTTVSHHVRQHVAAVETATSLLKGYSLTPR